MKRIGIYVFPDAEELDFVGVYEVLQSVRKVEAERRHEVFLISKQSEVQCAGGMTIITHDKYTGWQGLDVAIIPGGRGVGDVMQDRTFLDELADFAVDHLVCSVCTGALILGEARILDGKKATTHHLYRERLSLYCQTVEEKVILDGNVMTCGGVSSGLDLGLKVVEMIYNFNVARAVAERIEYQSPYLSQFDLF